ncbi:MAG: hypothetical protein AAF791_05500 [Bacteroidota bacterium]
MASTVERQGSTGTPDRLGSGRGGAIRLGGIVNGPRRASRDDGE